MTLDQIDQVLAAWNSRVAAIAENLMELQGQGTYRVLAGVGGLQAPRLSGVTRARVEPALAGMPMMLESFGRLNDVIEQANKLRADLPSIFGGEARHRQLEGLLFGRSVRLPAASVPLEQRNLLSGAEAAQGLTLDQVLQPMIAGFAAARDAVGLVDRAWEELAAGLDRAEKDAALLERELGSACDVILGPVRGQIEAVRAGVKTDPLGALETLNKGVQPALAGLHRRAERVAGVWRGLDAARARMGELRQVNAAAFAARERAEARIASCEATLPRLVESARLQALEEWLGRLTAHCEETTAEAVEIGLARWKAAVEACVAEAVRAREAAEAAVAERDELKGRLEALKAKARAYGRAEQERMTAMAGEAEGLLRTKPTDLGRARDIVQAYERELSRILHTNLGTEAGAPA